METIIKIMSDTSVIISWCVAIVAISAMVAYIIGNERNDDDLSN